MSYEKNREAIAREIKLFWENVTDGANTPNPDSVITGEHVQRLERRNYEAHTIVVEGYNEMLSAIDRCGRLRHRLKSMKVLANFGEEYCLKLLGAKILNEQLVQAMEQDLDGVATA